MTEKTIEHRVEKPGQRLDKYLAEIQIATSRSEALKWIEDGFVQINKKIPKPSYKVQIDDQILIHKPSIKTLDLTPKAVAFDVLFEDQDILVLNKPAGIAVHPGAGNYDYSLVHGLLYHCQGELSGIGGVERPGIVHRLDKGTSGVMVVAKSDMAHKSLTEQFQNRVVDKEYLALSLGCVQKDEQTLDHLMKRAEINRKKFVVNQKKGKRAITHLKVLQKNKRASFLAVKIDTGRTHQIRVHLSFIGHPIFGDETYGGTKKLHAFSEEEKSFIRGLGRPLLHSYRLSFFHPKTKAKMSFQAELGDDFKKALERLGFEEDKIWQQKIKF